MDPKSSNQRKFEEAEREANKLKEQVRHRGLDPAFDSLDKALSEFRDAGYPIDALVPADAEPRLGFSLTRASDGKSFWQVYKEVVREELCKEDGELQRLVKAGLAGSTGALITAIMTGLALPGAAFGIAVPIAGILAAKGVDAFCQFTEE